MPRVGGKTRRGTGALVKAADAPDAIVRAQLSSPLRETSPLLQLAAAEKNCLTIFVRTNLTGFNYSRLDNDTSGGGLINK